jgi:hypothetical protein
MSTAEEQKGEVLAEAEGTETTTEYKTSENAKKGVADILAADSGDESLRKYKESLLGAAAAGEWKELILNTLNNLLHLLFVSLAR